jgi:hypothetical protein
VLALLLLGCGGAPQSSTSPMALPNAPSGATYAIHMHRADRLGERVRVVVDATEEKRTAMFHELDRVIDQKDTKRVHIDAVAKVLAVGPKDEASEIAYDVESLTVDGKRIFHGKLDVTRARKEDDAIIVDQTGRVSTEVHDALKAVLSLRSGGPTDDEIFGTSKPQPVGGRWPIDNRLAQDDLFGDTSVVASVTGDVTLASVKKVGSVDCLELRSELELTGFELPNLPSGATIESGVMNAELSMVLPVDERGKRLEDHMSYRMRMKLKITGNPNITTSTIDVTSHKDGVYTQM